MSLISNTEFHSTKRCENDFGLSGRKRSIEICLGMLICLTAGCAQEMMNQPRVDPQEATAAWGNQSSMRALPPHTVPAKTTIMDQMGEPYARLWPNEIPVEQDETPPAEIDERQLPQIPDALTKGQQLQQTLQRGRERYQIWCLPCHGQLGNGNGEVARRGYYYPASFHTPKLRTKPIGYFYEIIRLGKKNMPAYQAMIAPEDRWSIAAYVRALQLSQSAPESLLTDTDLKRLKTRP